MAVMMTMEWPGVTKEQYDEVRKSVNWEGDTPQGTRTHVACFSDDGAHIVDVWDSQEDFDNFMQSRLAAGIQAAGLEGQPKVEFYPVHATFSPNPL